MFKIKYSKSFEIKRVIETLRKLDWLKEKGYSLSLPAGLDFGMEFSKLKLTDIKKLIDREYRENDYQKIDLMIKKKSAHLLKSLPGKFSKFGLKSRPVYFVFLTKYGVGGSYETPNKIIININRAGTDEIVRTIIHETIHLSMENFIRKHKIGHWKKEGLIDLVFSRIFPKIFQKQNLPKEALKANKIFDQFFGGKVQ